MATKPEQQDRAVQEPAAGPAMPEKIRPKPPRGSRTVRRVAFVVALVMVYITWILVQRLLTWDFLRPWQDMVIRTGIPSALAGFLALVFIVFDKSEWQKRFRRWLETGIEQTRMPFAFLCLSIVVAGTASTCTVRITPIRWAHFIDEVFLKGENDYGHAYAETDKLLDALAKDHPDASAAMRETTDVFKLRYRLNQEMRTRLSASDWKLLQAVCNSERMENDQLEAFRLFGLARARSEYLRNLSPDESVNLSEARSDYRRFLKVPSHATTAEWRYSATLNTASMYYYEKHYEEALKLWEKLPERPSVQNNMSDAYAKLGKFDKALQAANRGLEMVKVPPFSSQYTRTLHATLVENKMIAQMGMQGPTDAIRTFHNNVTKQNEIAGPSLDTVYCVALLLARDPSFDTTLADSKLMKEDDKNLVRGLWELKRRDPSSALRYFRLRAGYTEPVLSDARVAEKLRKELDTRSLLVIPAVQDLLKRLSN